MNFLFYDLILGCFQAGHETTMSALSFTIYMLAQHPEVLEKMYAEVKSVCGDREPTWEDIQNLE